MAAFALRDYTAMNGAGWPFCSFLSFLAAYTAVNVLHIDAQAAHNFLAAYTAVNEARAALAQPSPFLAVVVY